MTVTMIFVFLAWVVLPLFTGATSDDERTVSLQRRGTPLRFAVDEYRAQGWALFEDGTLVSFRTDDGATLIEQQLFDEADLPTAVNIEAVGDLATFGFADGSVRRARIGFETTFRQPEDLPPELRELPHGERVPLGGGLLERLPGDSFRLQTLSASLDDPIRTSFDSALRFVDRAETPSGGAYIGLDESGTLALFRTRTKKNLLTGKSTTKVTTVPLPYEASEQLGPPDYVRLSGAGDMVYLVWDDGLLQRINVQDATNPRLVERTDLVPEAGESITSFGALLGRRTLLVGDSRGRVNAWFLTKPQDAVGRGDGAQLSLGHSFNLGQAAVTSLAPSGRSRVFAAGLADGSVSLCYATADTELLRLDTGGPTRVDAVSLAPKQDGLYAWTDSGLWGAGVDVRHPEATLHSMFAPIWYEGYEGAEHVWQSSSGTDDFEPKLGLMPLVFGTIKATFYSMLFGVPIALLAAIYTSEFLSPRLRAPVKSVTETMASLPSVVLGFLAALVIAPFVQSVLPAVIASFMSVPFALVAGAYTWQLLPQRWQVRYGGWQRFALIGAALPFGLGLAVLCGPLMERMLFAGDVELWLDGQAGSAIAGWMLLTFPISILVVVFGLRPLDTWMRSAAANWSVARYAQADFIKFALSVLAILGVSWALASVLTVLGWDPRGSLLSTYVQRNALVVGFVMGFAIIPIIYTLAEDALSSVPEHLRLASLGAGATPWQTAVRVIVPTAMSGLFSAVMIGLGRAVGETMIVLMATGNTPVMEWNVFNGFRTLSANIAVELPEAVQNDTHYRTLFFAALILFAMTFVLNTFAELVRQRFRKRAYQL